MIDIYIEFKREEKLNKDLTVDKSYHDDKIKAYIYYGSNTACIGEISDSYLPGNIEEGIVKFRNSILPDNILDTLHAYASDEVSEIIEPLLVEGYPYKFYDEVYTL